MKSIGKLKEILETTSISHKKVQKQKWVLCMSLMRVVEQEYDVHVIGLTAKHWRKSVSRVEVVDNVENSREWCAFTKEQICWLCCVFALQINERRVGVSRSASDCAVRHAHSTSLLCAKMDCWWECAFVEVCEVRRHANVVKWVAWCARLSWGFVNYSRATALISSCSAGRVPSAPDKPPASRAPLSAAATSLCRTWRR